jgi:hypothetical protein
MTHLLTITPTEDHTEEDSDYRFEITCHEPEKCNGFWECMEPHKVDGKSAAAGPYDCSYDDPWCDEDEFEFHGVVHTWHYGWGWTVPYPGCVVAANEHWTDDAWDIAREHGPGVHEVDDDWNDDSCILIWLRKVGEAA